MAQPAARKVAVQGGILLMNAWVDSLQCMSISTRPSECGSGKGCPTDEIARPRHPCI